MAGKYNEHAHYQLERIVEAASRDLRCLFPTLSPRYVGGTGTLERLPRAFVVGEAPGAQEEMTGRPFAGPSGVMLRQLMRLADLDPADCWITNVVKYRPPRNRTPTIAEINGFRKVLQDEWRVMGRPRLIIPVGAVALNAITRDSSILPFAGKVRKQTPSRVVFPQLHPAFGLRGSDKVKEQLEADWEALGAWLRANPT